MMEGWCYGTMSVSALSKGYYRHRGLWEMTLRVLLLILAVAACLTEPGCCDETDGSGLPQAEAPSTSISTTTTHTSPVTGGTESSTFTVTTTTHTPGTRSTASTVTTTTHTPGTRSTASTVLLQEEEVSGGAETLAQVTWEQNYTMKQSPNKTMTDVKLKSAPKSSVNISVLERQDVPEHSNNTQDDTTLEMEDTWNEFIIGAACFSLALLLAAATAGILIMCRRRKKNTADPEKDDPYLDDEFGEKVPMPMFEDDMPSVMELEMEDLEKWMIKRGSDMSVDSNQRHPS